MPPSDKTIRLPGGPIIPLGALAICIAFLSSATLKNLVAGAIALAVGAAIYFTRRSHIRAESLS
jgi:hypothetical protein